MSEACENFALDEIHGSKYKDPLQCHIYMYTLRINLRVSVCSTYRTSMFMFTDTRYTKLKLHICMYANDKP